MTCRKAASCLLMLLVACVVLTPTAARAELDNLYGEVTQGELDRFKLKMQDWTPGENNIGNEYAYGPTGAKMKQLGKLIEISNDVEFLDKMITFADAMLAARNDPQTGRVLWTGDRALVWPNQPVGSDRAKNATSENGDVIGHIANCARLILMNRTLWHAPVNVGDPHGYGATYLERARTYVRELEKTMQSFVLPYFVDPQTRRLHNPTHPQWQKHFRNGGRPTPWNQQSMFCRAFQNLAICHEVLGNEAKAEAYDAIVQTAIDWFVENLVDYKKDGHDVVKWLYILDDDHIEDKGHASYDIEMMVRAYYSGRYDVPLEAMRKLANTAIYVAAEQGVPAGKTVTRPGQIGRFQRLSGFDKQIYNIVYGTSPRLSATLLWFKHLYHTSDTIIPDSSPPYLELDIRAAGETVTIDPLLVTAHRRLGLEPFEIDRGGEGGDVRLTVSFNEDRIFSGALPSVPTVRLTLNRHIARYLKEGRAVAELIESGCPVAFEAVLQGGRRVQQADRVRLNMNEVSALQPNEG